MVAAEPGRPPAIGAAAFGRRLERIRAAMERSEFDFLLVVNAREHGVRYLGFYDPEHPSRPFGLPNIAAALLPLDAEPVLFASGESFLEHRIRGASLISDVRLVDGPVQATVDAALDRVAELRSRGRLALAGRELEWAVGPRANRQLPEFEVVEAADWLDALRIRKEPEEVALMREANRIADRGAVAAIAAVGEGATDRDVYAAAEQAMRVAGADENSFSLIGFAGGRETELAEALAGRVIAAGDVVLYEALPFCAGYNAELMVTVAVDEVSPAQHRTASACGTILTELVRRLGPGTSTGPLAAFGRELFAESGLPGPTHALGHFLGIDNYEGPPLDGPTVLEPGMVITLHPNLVVPGGPRAIAHGTYLITERGAEALSASPGRGLYRAEDVLASSGFASEGAA